MFTACSDEASQDWNGRTANLLCLMNNNAPSRWAEPGEGTRGQRITGEVFQNGVTSLGIYGKVGTEMVLSPVKYTVGTTEGTFQYDEAPWFTKEVELVFSGEGGWPDGAKGFFYGYAPYPGSAADEAKCYTVDFSTTPTMTFTMQPNEADNKDIIDAKTENIERSDVYADGIKLQFRHVLSALKFKFDNANVKAHVDGTDYYIQLKSVKLIGVKNQGTAPIGGDLDAALWTPASTTADCSINNSLTWTELKADANKASDGKFYLNNDEHCLLVLPQTAPDGAKIAFKCDLTTDEAGTTPYLEDITIEASLTGQTWLPGRSYTYTLGQTNTATLWVSPGVMNWQVGAGNSIDLNMDYGSNLSFDMFYYRYDAVSLDNWSDSYVMVSNGNDSEGRPQRSPFMTCDIQLGTGLDKVCLESSSANFQFVKATETTDPDHPITYTTSAKLEVTTDGTLRYYVVPTSSATDGETTVVRMVGYKGGSKVAVLAYNADVMPGSSDHTTISYIYFSTTDYDNAGSNTNVRTEMAK